MKQLELDLKKRLLIVEYETFGQTLSALEVFKNGSNLNYPEKLEFICKGSELTEEIAKGLVKNEISDYLVEWAYDYKNEEQLNLDTFTCFESYISAIEANGYYWGENPIQSTVPTSDLTFYDNVGVYHHCLRVWQEAESHTFNPVKTLIFEIL